MNYFDYYNFDKSRKIGIDCLTLSVSTNIASHRSSWLYLLKNQLDNEGYSNVKVLTKSDKWDDYYVMIIYYCSSYNDGKFSTFGNYEKVRRRMFQFQNYNGILFSLHNKCANISKFVQKNKFLREVNLELIEYNEERSIALNQVRKYENAVIGDSHAASVYRPSYMVSRNNFNTLYGALKKGLDSYLTYEMEHVIFYFGNIDVRHHFLRRSETETKKLYEEYVRQIEELIEKGKIKSATIVEPLPIEHEERCITKMGKYNGNSFYGSIEARKLLRGSIESHLGHIQCKNIDIFWWPKCWEALSGKEFAERYMEKPAKSVHLSRSGYYWDFENNKINKEHE